MLGEISRRNIEAGLGWRWRAGAIAERIRDEDSCVVVAREAGAIAGFAAMSFDFAAARGHLLLLAVVPEARRQGLATSLLDWLEVLARCGGIRRVELEVRARARPARAFYAQRGFQEIARLPGYYQGREDGLRLAKRF